MQTCFPVDKAALWCGLFLCVANLYSEKQSIPKKLRIVPKQKTGFSYFDTMKSVKNITMRMTMAGEVLLWERNQTFLNKMMQKYVNN